MRAQGLAPLALLALLLAGCLGGGPALRFEDLFTTSDASYAQGHYDVAVRGRLVNGGAAEARLVRAAFAVAGDCFSEPFWVHEADLGNLAAGSATNVRESFRQDAPPFGEPSLWARVTTAADTRGAVQCGPLGVG